MIYPDFPKKDDIIGICAPSAGVGHKIESFELSLDALRERGYEIKETASVRALGERSASAELRATEFHSLLQDSGAKALIAATGGDYNMEVLPYLNEEIIKANPKWVCGYSDPTNILYYMTTKLDIATIYGFNAGTFDWRPLHSSQTNALDILAGNLVDQPSFPLWDAAKDWDNVKLDTPVSWDLYLPAEDGPSSNPLDCCGRLIGGCTDIISKLIGTPYDGTVQFIEKYSSDGFIWFFDTFDMSPEVLHMTMMQMKYAGYFKNAKAIIFGRVMFSGGADDTDYIKLLKLSLNDIPFIWGADIGHTKPFMTIINGAIGTLHCSNGAALLKMSTR